MVKYIRRKHISEGNISWVLLTIAGIAHILYLCERVHKRSYHAQDH